MIAEAQKDGGSCCFIDAEHALSIEYAQRVGVDLNSLFLSQPDSGEQALEIADTLVRSGGADVVVIDSVAALVPKAELEGDMGDAHVALQARLMSQALRKLTSSLSRSNTLIIFINQIRSKVGCAFIYRRGMLLKERPCYPFPLPSPVVFFLAPLMLRLVEMLSSFTRRSESRYGALVK